MKRPELIATIKIDAKLSFLEKICEVIGDNFTVATQSPVKKNDRDDNVHVFLTLIDTEEVRSVD